MMASNYEQLVKALRCKRDDCEGCDLAFFDKDEGWICQYAAKDDDAADAIEELTGFLSEAERDRDEYEERMRKEQERVIELQAEVERLEADVDAVPVVHGHWVTKTVRGDYVPCCSECGLGNGTLYEYDYCPNCGADMRAKMEVQE